jgi:hypothetical protein
MSLIRGQVPSKLNRKAEEDTNVINHQEWILIAKNQYP